MAPVILSRLELQGWIQEYLEEPLKDLRDCKDGLVLLQILDGLVPGTVNWRQVHLPPRTEPERQQNLRAFERFVGSAGAGVPSPFPVLALSQGQLKPLLEAFSWLKAVFDENWDGTPYERPAALSALDRAAQPSPFRAPRNRGIPEPPPSRLSGGGSSSAFGASPDPPPRHPPTTPTTASAARPAARGVKRPRSEIGGGEDGLADKCLELVDKARGYQKKMVEETQAREALQGVVDRSLPLVLQAEKQLDGLVNSLCVNPPPQQPPAKRRQPGAGGGGGGMGARSTPTRGQPSQPQISRSASFDTATLDALKVTLTNLRLGLAQQTGGSEGSVQPPAPFAGGAESEPSTPLTPQGPPSRPEPTDSASKIRALRQAAAAGAGAVGGLARRPQATLPPAPPTGKPTTAPHPLRTQARQAATPATGVSSRREAARARAIGGGA